MKQLSNVRKAVAGVDDATLTRWVKEPGRHAPGRRMTPPMPADATGTRYKTRVLQPDDMGQVLVSGHNNVKIGRDVRKGHLKGYWIYTLSLEERATCPRSCAHWRDCYGNAMPFAKRVAHGPKLLKALEQEIPMLLGKRGRVGLLVRLHALGDFYDREYVRFWWRMLRVHPRLAVFGYTAHNPFSEIGLDIAMVMHEFGQRAVIRFSGYNGRQLSTVAIDKVEDCPPDAFVCPEQTGRTACCATCGACWGTTKNVGFLNH